MLDNSIYIAEKRSDLQFWILISPLNLRYLKLHLNETLKSFYRP